jgi:hypothetical protein
VVSATNNKLSATNQRTIKLNTLKRLTNYDYLRLSAIGCGQTTEKRKQLKSILYDY